METLELIDVKDDGVGPLPGKAFTVGKGLQS